MNRLCAISIFAALAACASGPKVQTEFNKDAAFQSYKTWAPVAREPGPEEAPGARDPRIREAVIDRLDKGLAAKGLTRVQAGQEPDLYVMVHGWATNRIEINSYGYHYGPYTYAYGGGMYTTQTDVRNYRDGTLIIDLIDAAKKELVWRGVATDTFQPGAEASKVAEAIDKTLGEYPPQVQK